MEETGLIFAKNVPIEGAGESLVTLCVSMASLLVFNGFSKSACFSKKILAKSVHGARRTVVPRTIGVVGGSP